MTEEQTHIETLTNGVVAEVDDVVCEDEGCPQHGTEHGHAKEHVHGPDCSHDHEVPTLTDEVDFSTPEETESNAVKAFIETIVADRDKGLNTVPVVEIARILRSAPKGTKKNNLGRVMMMPKQFDTQIYVLFLNGKKMWDEHRWLALHQTFRLVHFFIAEEAQRRVTRATAHFKKYRLALEQEAKNQGLELGIDPNELVKEVSKLERMFRQPLPVIKTQDVFKELPTFQGGRIVHPGWSAKLFTEQLPHYGLKIQEPAVEAANDSSSEPTPEIENAESA